MKLNLQQIDWDSEVISTIGVLHPNTMIGIEIEKPDACFKVDALDQERNLHGRTPDLVFEGDGTLNHLICGSMSNILHDIQGISMPVFLEVKLVISLVGNETWGGTRKITKFPNFESLHFMNDSSTGFTKTLASTKYCSFLRYGWVLFGSAIMKE